MSIKAIIFDLDGTLLYTLEDLMNSLNYALKKCSLPERNLQDVRNFVGNGVYKLIERSVGKYKERIDDCYEIFKKHYANNSTNLTTPYKGIIENLKKLKEKGIKLAVLSNKLDFAVKNLVNFYFKNTFDIVKGETPEYPKKPNPKCTLDIVKQFGVKNEEVLFVGDSEVDIQTAKNSNITCISVLWGYKDKEFLIKNSATHLICSFDEIFNFL